MSLNQIVPVSLLVVLLLASCAATAERSRTESAHEGMKSTSFALGSGVIIASDDAAAYVMTPAGGIDAIDIRTGRPGWRTTVSAVPLALVSDRLVTQAVANRPGVLPIAVFDIGGAGTATLSTEVPLPTDIFAYIDLPLGTSFVAEATANDNSVDIVWNYLEQVISSVAPPPGTSPIRRRAEGSAQIDLRSGEVQVPDRRPEPVTSPLPLPIRHLIESGELRHPPWQSGSILAATAERATAGGNREVVLRRWDPDTGEEFPEVVLFEGRPRAIVPSADRRHVAVTSSLPQEQNPVWHRYRWSVFSLESGEREGEMSWHTSATPFCALNGTLLTITQPYSRRIEGEISEQPLALRAVSLDSGAQIWSRPLRDTTYRGPHPAGP